MGLDGFRSIVAVPVGVADGFPQSCHTRFLAVMSSVLQTTWTKSGIGRGSLPQIDIVAGGGTGAAA